MSCKMIWTRSKMPRQSAKSIETLQWGRAIAALSVALGHLIHEASKINGFEDTARDMRAAFPFEVGVDIFFVISGFIMVYTTDGRLAHIGAAANFIKSRISRIVPLYWFYTFLMVAVMILLPKQFDTAQLSLSQLLYSLIFVPGIGGEVTPLLSLGWTLNYEMAFYICFAAGILVARRHIVLVLTVFFTSLLILKGLYNISYAPFSFFINLIILEFCAGMILAKAFISGVRFTASLSIIGLGLSFLFLTFSMHTTASIPRVVSLGIPSFFIVAALVLTDKKSKCVRQPRLQLLKHIGDASYTLYLSHPFTLSACFVVFKFIGASGVYGGVLYIVITFLLFPVSAIILYKTIEKPLVIFSKKALGVK